MTIYWFDPISQITSVTSEFPVLSAFILCQTDFEGCHLEVWMPIDAKDYSFNFGDRAISVKREANS